MIDFTYKTECIMVKDICDKLGYGNVMEWASALWRYNAKKNNYPIEGCFVPTCQSFIKKKYWCLSQQNFYDELVKNSLE